MSNDPSKPAGLLGTGGAKSPPPAPLPFTPIFPPPQDMATAPYKFVMPLPWEPDPVPVQPAMTTPIGPPLPPPYLPTAPQPAPAPVPPGPLPAPVNQPWLLPNPPLDEHPSVVNAPGRPRLVGGEAFIAEAHSAPEWLWHGIIPANGITLFSGDPCSYKTIIMLLLSVAARSGTALAGRAVKASKVIYVKLEHLDGTYADVLRKAKVAMGVNEVNNLHILREFSLDDDELLDYACECADQIGAEAIIIDSLRRAHRGDENGSQDAAEHVRRLQRLSGDGKRAVVAIHHLAKGTNTHRGSGDYRAGVDASVTVTKVGNQVTLKTENHASADGEVTIAIEFSTDMVTATLSESPTMGGDTTDAQVEAAMIKVCTSPGNLGSAKLRTAVQDIVPVSNERVDDIRKKLEKMGIIRNDGTAKKHMWNVVMPQGGVSSHPPSHV